MAELESITVRGFKSIESIEDLKLGAINIIIGPNGSGKSNFIGVFSFLNAIREGRLQEYVLKAGGANRILYFGSKVTEDLYIKIIFQEGVNQYQINFQPTETDELISTSEFVYFWDKKAHPNGPFGRSVLRSGKEAGISTSDSDRIKRYVQEHLTRWRVYHFHDTSSSSLIKQTTDINDNRFLRPDASNLAPFLFYLKQKEQDSYGLIRRAVQRVAPFFDDFLLEPQKLNPEKIKLEWKHKKSEAYFDAASLSDGTLRFMALSTLFLQPETHRPSVILVDEPELGLHPFAIAMLASLVKQASIKTQVILSTQSSLLLDHFQPEDVLVTNLVNESTQFTRLEPEKLKTWLEDYSLGQLWEKNELGGRPGGG
jgi:predicted ATPase